MKVFYFVFIFSFILSFIPYSLTTSIELPALWVFVDYNMPLATFDSDAPLHEELIIERIKCILRLPEHLIVFNYRSPYGAGIRTNFQIIADLINVRPKNRTKVGTSMILAFQKALDQARDDGKLNCFANWNSVGLNSMPMTAWVSERTITIAPYDANNFTACPAGTDYSEIVRNTFTAYLNETSFDYFTDSWSDQGDNVPSNQTLNGQRINFFLGIFFALLTGMII